MNRHADMKNKSDMETKEMQYETFIAVHDQDLILCLENNNIFRYLKNYKYIFLGMRPVDKISMLPNVIIAREQDNNIEKYKVLCDFTGWYALIKNNIISAEYVVLIQFDSFIRYDFDKKTKKMLALYPDSIIGYQPHRIKASYFLEERYSSGLVKCLKDLYSCDVHRLVEEALTKGDQYWPGGTSIACSKKILCEFVEWSLPMIEILGKDPMGGHSMERSVKMYCLLHKINNEYLPEVMEHIYACSHEQSYTSQRHQQYCRNRLQVFLNGDLPEFKRDSIIWHLLYKIKNMSKIYIKRLIGR